MKRVAVMMAACGLAACGGAFEKIAQADHWDFSGHFDVETEDGIRAIIDHIQLTGANTLAWRVNGGSSPRYWSREENALDMAPAFNPVRIPDGRAVQGRIRLFGGGAGVDAYKFALEELGRRKLGRCAYWPYEENHHFTSKVGAWNLDHPQFWCMTRDGKPWMGRASIAFPEVRAHKLRLLDEILAYGPDSIYVEAWRTGGWTVADEYVKPNLDAWRAKHRIGAEGQVPLRRVRRVEDGRPALEQEGDRLAAARARERHRRNRDRVRESRPEASAGVDEGAVRAGGEGQGTVPAVLSRERLHLPEERHRQLRRVAGCLEG